MGNNGKSCNLGIFEMIKAIQGCMSCKVENRAKSMGLSSTQMLIVFEVFENEDISLNGLCEKMDLPKSTVSRLVDDLVKKEILIREIPPENRRMVKLRIAQDYQVKGEIDTMEKGLIGNLDDEKRRRILAALEELRSALD